jgi:glycerate dehydrogenase
MAEHVLAMALALAKRLPQKHADLAQGKFKQFPPTRSLRGAVCGILGFGGIGRATARLVGPLGARIHAVNTSGRSDEPVEWVGTLGRLDEVLRAADILVVALPLTQQTRGLIGRRELELMKPDAILVNVARGAIVDEGALYEHLRSHPDFMAGIDAWWKEPLTSGEFRVDHPFFALANLLGSPHNSAIVPGILVVAARRAAENVARFLRGEPVRGIVNPEDYEDVEEEPGQAPARGAS